MNEIEIWKLHGGYRTTERYPSKIKKIQKDIKIGNYGMIFIINSVRYTNYKVVGK